MEGSISQVAFSNNVPTYAFKHTGIESVFFNPQLLDTYRDYNQTFTRNQCVHTKEEEKIFNDSKNINAIFIGNLKQKSNEKIKPLKQRKIIYSVGPMDCKGFHSHYCNLSDIERHIWTKQLINSVHTQGLSLDIKLHPIRWTDLYEYYLQMIANNKKTIQLIAGGSIERKLQSYDLLILDMVPTQVLSSALTLGMNIIIFRQHEFLYNPKTYKDLEERVHFVNDSEELTSKLSAFKEGQLENKVSESFNSKYLSYDSRIKDIISNYI